MPRGHLPVLPDVVSELLIGPQVAVVLDCTVGLGGHAELILSQLGPGSRLIGLDVDPANLSASQQRLAPFGDRVTLRQANFTDARSVLDDLGLSGADALLADLGVASTQLDDPQRGMSFSGDGPLDMRMDPTLEQTAEDLVARMDEKELADLIYEYGEERYSRRIASAIVEARRRGCIERTRQLADIVAKAYPFAAKRSRRGVHPATRTFQALRIAVNDELGSLERLLAQLPGLLNTGGRACMISFHSLEDRRVKHAFASLAAAGTVKLLTKKPRVAGDAEVAGNPRSRSAKLRGLERIC